MTYEQLIAHLRENYRRNNPTAAGSPDESPALGSDPFELEEPTAAGSQEESPAAGSQEESPAAGAPNPGTLWPAQRLGRPKPVVEPQTGTPRNTMADAIAQEQGRSDLARLASREQELDSERSHAQLEEAMGRLGMMHGMYESGVYE